MPYAPSARTRRRCDRLVLDRRANAALEFAFVGPLLILLSCMIMQFGLQVMTQWSLDLGVRVAARQVQIGNVWAGGQNPQVTFTNDICGGMPFPISNCANSLQMYVVYGASFSGMIPAAVDHNGNLVPTGFNAPTSGSDVVIQVVYKLPNLVSWLSQITGGTSLTLLSVVTLQNEAYAG